MLAQKARQDDVRQGLRELGYVEGENLVIEARSNEHIEQLRALSTELVNLKPDAIFAAGTQAVQAVHEASRTIPIVMVASDPVGDHLVASLARPGGNLTGVSLLSPELTGKRFEVLQRVTGNLSFIAVLWNPGDPPAVAAANEMRALAKGMHIDSVEVEVRRVEDIESAFERIREVQPQALIILNSPFLGIQAARVAAMALALKLPSIYTNRQYPEAGGLMSYGPNFSTATIRVATYLDRIFKGAKPAEMPIEQPTKFEFVINQRTARALGLTIADSVLASADDVIE